MSKSGRLRLRDIRAAFRVAGEARDLGESPDGWRIHVIRVVKELIGASVAMTLEMHGFLPGESLRWVAPCDLGWETDHERRLFLGYLGSDLPKDDPAVMAWMDCLSRRRFKTAMRREMLEDVDWYGSSIVSEGRRSSRIDDCIASIVTLGRPGRVHGFQFYRPWNESGFRTRDRKLVQLIHTELVRALEETTPGDQNRLPPRVQPVLRGLFEGKTSKQIASQTGLSIHTIDGYVKEIYRLLGVGSRAQLLARQLHAPKPRRLVLPPEF